MQKDAGADQFAWACGWMPVALASGSARDHHPQPPPPTVGRVAGRTALLALPFGVKFGQCHCQQVESWAGQSPSVTAVGPGKSRFEIISLSPPITGLAPR